MAELKVTITGGRKNLGEEMTVALDGPVIVGRSHSAAIRFSNEEADVSGKHLEFTMEGGQLWVRNLKRDIKVNGAALATGGRRSVKAGDSFEIGTRARFRVDSVSGVDGAEADAPSSATGATQVMTEGTFATATANPTMATRVATETIVTRVATETEATRLADAPNLPNDSDETVAMGLADDLSGDDRPTDALTGDGVTTTGSAASTGGGETIALGGSKDADDDVTRKIPQWLLDDLNKKQRQREAQKRHVRQSLLAVAILVFAGVLGAIVYARWPKAELELSVPRIDGTDKADLESHELTFGGHPAFVVDYPRDPRMRKSELDGGRGIDVSTFTGRDRDVPFRLRLSRSTGADELTRSLSECAQAKMKAAESAGFVFLSPNEWQSGVCFVESEYPGSVGGALLMRGTPFFRSEYEIVRGEVKWHGILFVFRNGDTAFVLQREIPEREWTRGRYLLRDDPNIQFHSGFLSRRWDSPGRDGFITKMDPAAIIADVTHELDMSVPRVSEWPRIKRELNTLIAISWAKTAQRESALALLKRFREQQDRKYTEFRLNFDLAKTAGQSGLRKMESIREDCRKVFGVDPSDRRFLLINNPEKWSCLDEP